MTAPLAARRHFPRGLSQPAAGFRFSMDALLLASYVQPGKWRTALDIGTGCGVVALALLVRHGSKKQVTAVDLLPEMLQAARDNARLLDLEPNLQVIDLDIRDTQALRAAIAPQSLDIALANPPYRATCRGRLSATPLRTTARFETSAGLDDFCAAAAYCLKNRGRFHLVYLAERLPEACRSLAAHGLELKRLRPVQGKEGQGPRLLLLEARKQARPGMIFEPPLILYHGAGAATRLTQEALAFCPFLACNAGPQEE